MAVSEHQQAMIISLARQWAAERDVMGRPPTVAALAARLQRYGQAQGFPRPHGQNPWPLEIAEAALDEVSHAG